jgi:hypothetical protein
MATAGVASSDRVRAIKNTPRAGWVQGGRDETARLVDGMGARRWRRLVVVVVVSVLLLVVVVWWLVVVG